MTAGFFPLLFTLYAPQAPVAQRRPLILFLHGCNESAEEFAGGARIAKLAQERGYYVLLPKQDASSNPERCWNWFLPANQVRDGGEAHALASLVRDAIAQHPVDPSRVYVAGLSAGGAMANIMASCYPDLFSAVAIHSGMGFRAASDPWGALWSVSHGSLVPPEWSGWLAYQCSGGQEKPLPLLLIQGTEDRRVLPVNARQILEAYAVQNDWADDGLRNGTVNLDHPSTASAQVPGGYPYTVTTYGGDLKPLLRFVSVEGMGHAWSGGDPAFPRTDPKGPDFTRMMMDFFERQEKR
jgi:poly(hydroxyalkanoate) depolymerase family esterase